MKKWYESKIFWASLSAFIVGLIDVVSDFLANADYSYESIFMVAIAVFTLIARVWFTDKAIG